MKPDTCNDNIISLDVFCSYSLKVAERIKPKHVSVIVIFKFNKYLFWLVFCSDIVA